MRNELLTFIELDTPRELQSLTSEINITSVFSFAIPYILIRWCIDPKSETFNELQFIEDMVIFGEVTASNIAVWRLTIRLKSERIKGDSL